MKVKKVYDVNGNEPGKVATNAPSNGFGNAVAQQPQTQQSPQQPQVQQGWGTTQSAPQQQANNPGWQPAANPPQNQPAGGGWQQGNARLMARLKANVH